MRENSVIDGDGLEEFEAMKMATNGRMR